MPLAASLNQPETARRVNLVPAVETVVAGLFLLRSSMVPFPHIPAINLNDQSEDWGEESPGHWSAEWGIAIGVSTEDWRRTTARSPEPAPRSQRAAAQRTCARAQQQGFGLIRSANNRMSFMARTAVICAGA
jgi:hypothetical protein